MTVPADAKVGDTLNVIVNGGQAIEVTITAEILKDGYTTTVPRPQDGETVDAKATIKDQAGNESAPGQDKAIVGDTTKPTIDIDPINPKNPTDPITGTTEPGLDVTVTFPNGSTQTTVADSNGRWEVPNPGNLKDADTVTAIAKDPAGNEGSTKEPVDGMSPKVVVELEESDLVDPVLTIKFTEVPYDASGKPLTAEQVKGLLSSQGFEFDSANVDGGLVSTDGGLTWTAPITYKGGDVSAEIGEGSYFDAAGNAGTQGKDSLIAPKIDLDTSSKSLDVTGGTNGGNTFTNGDLTAHKTHTLKMNITDQNPLTVRAVINLDMLDNSFGINVNGVSLTNGKVIQLQASDKTPHTANQVFLTTADGNIFGDVGTSKPWVLNEHGLPRIQVVMTKDGVRFFGTLTPQSEQLIELFLQDKTVLKLPDFKTGENTVDFINYDGDYADGVKGSLEVSAGGNSFTITDADNSSKMYSKVSITLVGNGSLNVTPVLPNGMVAEFSADGKTLILKGQNGTVLSGKDFEDALQNLMFKDAASKNHQFEITVYDEDGVPSKPLAIAPKNEVVTPDVEVVAALQSEINEASVPKSDGTTGNTVIDVAKAGSLVKDQDGHYVSTDASSSFKIIDLAAKMDAIIKSSTDFNQVANLLDQYTNVKGDDAVSEVLVINWEKIIEVLSQTSSDGRNYLDKMPKGFTSAKGTPSDWILFDESYSGEKYPVNSMILNNPDTTNYIDGFNLTINKVSNVNGFQINMLQGVLFEDGTQISNTGVKNQNGQYELGVVAAEQDQQYSFTLNSKVLNDTSEAIAVNGVKFKSSTLDAYADAVIMINGNIVSKVDGFYRYVESSAAVSKDFNVTITNVATEDKEAFITGLKSDLVTSGNVLPIEATTPVAASAMMLTDENVDGGEVIESASSITTTSTVSDDQSEPYFLTSLAQSDDNLIFSLLNDHASVASKASVVSNFNVGSYAQMDFSALLTDAATLGNIGEFVTVNYNAENDTAVVSIDRDGTAAVYQSQDVLVLSNQVTNVTLDDLLHNNQIII